jgi:hypothetical protein
MGVRMKGDGNRLRSYESSEYLRICEPLCLLVNGVRSTSHRQSGSTRHWSNVLWGVLGEEVRCDTKNLLVKIHNFTRAPLSIKSYSPITSSALTFPSQFPQTYQ